MKITMIHNEEAHEAAIQELEKLMDSNPRKGSPRFEQMELLALVIKDFESKHYPLDPPDPIEAIRFRLEQQRLTQKDLERCLGNRVPVAAILSRRRPLTLAMMRRLHQFLGIPADVLIATPQ